MGRRAKPAKAKAEGKSSVTRKSLKNKTSRIGDFEKRLAEAVEREGEALNRESEALQQQKAMVEILRVISNSPTDAQPVFDVIVESAVRLCDATFCVAYRFDGALIHLAAHYGLPAEALTHLRTRYPRPPVGGNSPARAIREGRTIHISDFETDPEVPEDVRVQARLRGARSNLSVPMMRNGVCMGSVTVARRQAGSFANRHIELLKTFADQAVIALENVRLFKELEARNRDLTKALEQQTATSDVLRIIAQSPTELQPVLDAIASSAVRLCAASDVVIERLEGDRFYNAAHAGTQMNGLVGHPLPLTRHFPGGRAVLDRRPVIIDDIMLVAENEYPDTLELLKLNTVHSCAEIPLLSEGRSLGNLAVLRAEVRPFTDAEVALLQTFADQAVIAIENVRLFTELQQKNEALTQAHGQVTEALEQQTATSEILRVISSSPTDIQPVFGSIARSAVRLCRGYFCAVFRFDGQLIHLVAHHNFPPDTLPDYERTFPLAPHPSYTTGRAILTRSVVHVPNFRQAADFPLGQQLRRRLGSHAAVAVPMLRDGEPIGVINVGRAEAEAFTEAEIDLLKTFANQAVIAIENVRLFTELQMSNRELSTALATQTATSDILRVISRSQTDLQPVFDTIVRSAARLCRAHMASIALTDDDRTLTVPAQYGPSPEAMAALKAQFPRPLDHQSTVGTAILTRTVIQVPDVDEPPVIEFTRQAGQLLGYRSVLVVPILRDAQAIGSINVVRREPGRFSDSEVELLKTFADQAVIAIENVRLFMEIADKSRQLEAASQHKSEFLANMSHELRTPLNAILGFSEVLAQGMFGAVNDKQSEYLRDILDSGRHLLSLINDILDLSKIEAGRMELASAAFHLPSALENAVTLVKERATRHGIALHLDVDPWLGEVVGDERKVKQVLLNLLSNAVKFTPEGGRISLTALWQADVVVISVADTGVGIATEDQAAIFEEFRQVGSDERKREGTGLGLTLAKKFVELHGGRIWVESAAGRGSTFTFTLPAA